MNSVRADQDVAARRRTVGAVAAEEIAGDSAFVLRERAQPVAGVNSRFTEPLAYGFIYHRLQPAAVDRKLRIFETGIGAARLAPDLLADAVHVKQFVGSNSDPIEALKQPKLRQLLDRVR